MTNNTLSVSEAARYLGVCVNTLRRWDAEGKLQPAFTTEKGWRFYTREQLEQIKEKEGGATRHLHRPTGKCQASRRSHKANQRGYYQSTKKEGR